MHSMNACEIDGARVFQVVISYETYPSQDTTLVRLNRLLIILAGAQRDLQESYRRRYHLRRKYLQHLRS